MTEVSVPRRAFLADSTRAVTAGWLAVQLPLLAALTGCARDDARRGEALAHLTSAEARTMRAFATQIIPSDDGTPGADEAGVVHFVDRAVGMPFFADAVPLLRTGLADLDAHAQKKGGRNGFASLTSKQQMALMRDIETTPFFATARTLVVIGTFADPSYGGNRGGAGWAMIGIKHEASYTAPFGWYDAAMLTDAAKGAA
jgi:gluconate 2-dehydrogenase gamma chain